MNWPYTKKFNEIIIKKADDFRALNNSLIELDKSGLDFKKKCNLDVLLMLLYPTSLSKKEIISFIKKYEGVSGVWIIEKRRKVYRKNEYEIFSTYLKIERP